MTKAARRCSLEWGTRLHDGPGDCQGAGFEPYALTFRYGQRHKARSRRPASRGSLGVAQHVIVDIDLRLFGGSALTSDIAVPKGRCRGGDGARHPGHLCAGPQHDLPLVRARPGPRCSGPATFSSASTRWTTAAIPIAGRSTSRRSSGWRTWRPRPASKDGNAHDPHAADRDDKGGDHPQGHARWAWTTAMTVTCYDPSPSGEACGACDACLLRLKGFAESGIDRSGA